MSDLFQAWKENLIRTYGDRAYVSKAWLEKEWERVTTMAAQKQTSTPVSQAKKPLIVPEIPAVQKKNSNETLEEIRADLGDCTRCKLSTTRTNIVFGEGNPKAQLMFVGEGPGENEDLQGRPFVGRAGQLLDKIIEAMGMKRQDVFIANVVKCRPPQNRLPQPDEVATCSPFLFRQIDTIKPKVIVVLGATALKSLVGEDAKITKMRGNFSEYRGVPLMPTFHPAYLLRNPPAKKEVWEDMKKVMSHLGMPAPERKV